jgi:hypothetical protein
MKHSVNQAAIHCQLAVTEVGRQAVIVKSVMQRAGRRTFSHCCRTLSGTTFMELNSSRSLHPVAYRSSRIWALAGNQSQEQRRG